MNPGTDVTVLAIAGAIGYLMGSFSAARIVGRLVAPGADVTRSELAFDSGATYESRAVSASAVRANVGTRWGILTGILDASKVIVPILVARSLGYPEAVQIALALGGLFGHLLPLYHRFRGGLGETVTYGVLLLFDPLGVVASVVCSAAAGFALGRVVVLREAVAPIFAVWSLTVRGDALLAGFAIVATVAYRVAALPESRRFAAALRGRPVSNAEISRAFGMGAGLGRAIDRYGLPALLRRR